MSFWGKLLGTDKAVSKVFDAAHGLLDEAFYTDQEAAADKAAARTEAQSMVVEWMKSTTGSRLARRVIALSITGTWLFMYITATVLSVCAVWAGKRVEQLTASAGIIDERALAMNGAVMLILGFYFALPYLGDVAQGALKKFGGK